MMISIILVLIIISAIAAVEAVDLIMSAVFLGIAGIWISLAFLWLGATKLALIQLSLEMALLLIIIRATTSKVTRERLPVVPAIFAIVFILFSYVLFGKMDNISVQISKFGESCRQYDLLGAATAIFTATIGTLVILRPKGKK